MPEIEVGVACGGGATRAGGRRWRRMAEAALWRWIGDNKWGKSLTGAR